MPYPMRPRTAIPTTPPTKEPTFSPNLVDAVFRRCQRVRRGFGCRAGAGGGVTGPVALIVGISWGNVGGVGTAGPAAFEPAHGIFEPLVLGPVGTGDAPTLKPGGTGGALLLEPGGAAKSGTLRTAPA